MKLRQSLALKFLLPLNTVVLVSWGLYAYWNLSNIERNHIQAELEAIKHLGLGLRTAVEDVVSGRASMAHVQRALDELAREEQNLDIMVIDPHFRVVAATYKSRIGRRWYEEDIQAVLTGTRDVIWKTRSHLHEGHRAFDTTIGVKEPSGRIAYAIHIARRLDLVERAISEQIRRDILFAVLLLALISISVNALTYLLLIRRLNRLAHQVQSSEWGGGPVSRGGDELTQLASALAAMMERVRNSTTELKETLDEKERLLDELTRLKASLAEEVERVRQELGEAHSRIVRLERQSAQAELVNVLAHEIRNPLHIVRGAAELISKKAPKASDLARDVIEEVDRMDRLIRELLELNRPMSPSIHQFPVRALLEDVAEVCSKRHHEGRRIRVSVAGGADLEIHGDRLLLQQALVNLVDNALDVSPPDSEVELSASLEDGAVAFSVRDRGPGVDEEVAARAFEPFFTKKVEGIGLGLAIVERVAELHGGRAVLANWSGGAEARLVIPQPERAWEQQTSQEGLSGKQDVEA